jgi:uncharacterized protein
MHEVRMSLNAAPAWMLSADVPEAAGERGTILFWHGLTSSKEAQVKELQSLADAGFLAVGLDNAGHGERRLPDFDQQFSHTGSTEGTFLELVKATADEVSGVIDTLIARGYARADRIGAAGISMGGYILYRALLNDRRIRAAAALLGSPRWPRAFPESPHLAPEQYFPTALLSQCAGEDRSVPPRFARELHARLEPFYHPAPERLRYVEFPGVGHFMPADDWDRLWQNTLDWFDRFVGPKA